MSKETENAFRQFHADNPHVYERIVGIARTLHGKGVRRYSMRGIFYVLRYESEISTTGIVVWVQGEQRKLKLGNDFSPFYVRVLRHDFPELGAMFELRDSQADSFEFETPPTQPRLYAEQSLVS